MRWSATYYVKYIFDGDGDKEMELFLAMERHLQTPDLRDLGGHLQFAGVSALERARNAEHGDVIIPVVGPPRLERYSRFVSIRETLGGTT